MESMSVATGCGFILATFFNHSKMLEALLAHDPDLNVQDKVIIIIHFGIYSTDKRENKVHFGIYSTVWKIMYTFTL